ncbi:MAG TPA: chloride channel protein [Gemmataceae bacterium]|nr:chloride channel protein [Gemmataceae bacterium]
METKGDFTADLRLVWLSLLAIPVGGLCAVVALVLQRLIAFFTGLFYYHTISIPRTLIDPPLHVSGWAIVWFILVPVVGGLIIGLMARYGSERIRGHGIPEAMEAILISRSRMLPRVAVLKPLSSAISIGSGGPFGAEGPIIMTGGAFGSIIAQVFRMTAAERKALLVAGAAGGMAATFGTPIAAVLLAVELLLFEWKPRSLVPVAVASAVAVLVRQLFHGNPAVSLGADPLFAMPPLLGPPGVTTLLACIPVGLLAGALSLLLTGAVYAAEDAFLHLPIHWMWWPAIGGLAIGIGGCIEPHALGVGYDNIRTLLDGHYTLWFLVGLVLVKGVIWSVALGSGTSGGVLAPLLIMGGALGGLMHLIGLPGGDATFWPLIGMAAVMGGTMRSPLTGVLFATELTGNFYALLPLLIASVVAHGFTVLLMKRSILTEKVARRGYHVSREYSVDPLERLSVGEIMTAAPVTIPAELPLSEVVARYFSPAGPGRHQGYPVVSKEGALVGMVTRSNLLEGWVAASQTSAPVPIVAYDLIAGEAIVAYPWESCRTAAERMAQGGVGRLPVVSPEDPKKLVGIVTRSDLLKPRFREMEEESKRERLLSPRLFPGLRWRSPS